LWHLFSIIINIPYFPSPISVIKAILEIALIGDVDKYTLAQHIYVSVERVLLGFSIAAITAIPLGLIIGIKPLIKDTITPIIEPIRFIPPIAWIPLAIVLLVGITRYIFIIWVGAFFPILLNTIAGIKRTSNILIQMAKSFGSSRNQIIYKIIIPSSLPEVMTGLRVGLGVGWMCIVAAEMIGGEPIGLGRLIIKYAGLLRLDVVIAGMIVIGIIGMLMNYIILAIEKRLFKWRQEIIIT
jgi:NitT/TauT family transport system permease protein